MEEKTSFSTNSKAKRMIVALTCGGVLLLIILLSVMIFQIVRIKVEKSRYEALVAECETYKELIAKGEDTIEARTSYWWLVERARELGYVFDGDHIYQ